MTRQLTLFDVRPSGSPAIVWALTDAGHRAAAEVDR